MNHTETKLIRLLTSPLDAPIEELTLDHLWKKVKGLGETRESVRLILQHWCDHEPPYAVHDERWDCYSLTV